MDQSELEALFNDLESDRVERKSSVSKDVKNKIREAICAFANDLPNNQKPGVLFVGVNDDGSCASLRITDELLRTLVEMRADGNITPFPFLTVQKKTFNGCEVAVVLVEPADAPPVRYRGRVWVRVGPRRAVATAEEERGLTEKRRARNIPFDRQVASFANLNDLYLNLFQQDYLASALPLDILAQNGRSVEQQLRSMRFITTKNQPTIVDLLTIGQKPIQCLPGAYIQFLRFDGTELVDPIKDNKQIDGPLPDLLQELDEVFKAHISVALNIHAQAREIRQPAYPIVALRQLAYNAVLHRNYEGTNAPIKIYWFSDRIEIHSPGGPFGQVTRQNFGQPGITDYRNPHLAEVMRNLGYVQRFGIGIPLAKRELQKNGNPPLEFTAEDTYILAIIRIKI